MDSWRRPIRFGSRTLCALAFLSCTLGNYAPNLQAKAPTVSMKLSNGLEKSHHKSSEKSFNLDKFKITRMAWGLDKAYVTAAYIGAPHFRQDGWGFNPLDKTDKVYMDIKSRISALTSRSEPKPIQISWDGEEMLHEGVLIRDGRFTSPGADSLPEEARTAHFRAVWPQATASTCPMLVILPPNGDEAYDRRFKGLARQLALEHGIGSVMLVPPFYAGRRAQPPADAPPLRCGQHGSVARLLLTGIVSAEETRSLLQWLRQRGHALVGVSGASFGSFTACVAAACSSAPVAVAACLPCHSAEVCWTDSVMARMCDFQRLADDLAAAAGASGGGAAVGGPDSARLVLRGLLSELTDLTRFPPPVLTAAAVLVSARNDAYIPSESAAALHRHWPGSELRLHDGGHVTSFLFNRRSFRRACADAVARLRQYGAYAPFSARLFVDIGAASRPEVDDDGRAAGTLAVVQVAAGTGRTGAAGARSDWRGFFGLLVA